MLFFIILMLMYLIMFMVNMFRLFHVSIWAGKSQKDIDQIICSYSKKIWLIIPVMNEQTIIRDTFNHFRDISIHFPNLFIAFVTTNKEKSTNTNITTNRILKELISKDDKRIFLFNYPEKKGVMAHQINYAIKKIEEIEMGDDFWIGIYNADSRISIECIKYIYYKLDKVIDKENICFQQYSWYYKNSIAEKRSLIGSASLWQTRWSLIFELYRVLAENEKNRKMLNSFPVTDLLYQKMNYVIGHGFYIYAPTLYKLGGFPEVTINEDAFLGYLLNLNRINIIPVPFLEAAEFTDKISIYIKQQSVWFNGPLFAFQYLKLYIISREDISNYEKLRAFLLALKLFMHAVYWIGGPILLMCAFIYSLHSVCLIFIFIFVVLLYLPFTNLCVAKVVNKYFVKTAKQAKTSLIFCPMSYILHSFGPIRNIVLCLLGKNTIENKYKTER